MERDSPWREGTIDENLVEASDRFEVRHQVQIVGVEKTRYGSKGFVGSWVRNSRCRDDHLSPLLWRSR